MDGEGQGNEAATEQGAAGAGESLQVAGLLKDLQAERVARKAAEAKAAEVEAKAAEYAAWKAEAEPKLGKLSEYEQREQARADALVAQNVAELAALPEQLRALVPEGLTPEATAAQIGRLKAAPIASGTIVTGARADSLPPEATAFFDRNGVPDVLRTIAFYKQCNPSKP